MFVGLTWEQNIKIEESRSSLVIPNHKVLLVHTKTAQIADMKDYIIIVRIYFPQEYIIFNEKFYIFCALKKKKY